MAELLYMILEWSIKSFLFFKTTSQQYKELSGVQWFQVFLPLLTKVDRSGSMTVPKWTRTMAWFLSTQEWESRWMIYAGTITLSLDSCLLMHIVICLFMKWTRSSLLINLFRSYIFNIYNENLFEFIKGEFAWFLLNILVISNQSSCPGIHLYDFAWYIIWFNQWVL